MARPLVAQVVEIGAVHQRAQLQFLLQASQ